LCRLPKEEEYAMKARWTMAATLFAVAVATLALAGAAYAQSQKVFPSDVFHIDETFVDPYYSEVCGFPVVQHDVGVIKSTFFATDPNGDIRVRLQVSIRQTVTNPQTGTSLTGQTSGAETTTVELLDENGSFLFAETFVGLNFLLRGLKGPDGTPLPNFSGRGVQFFSVTFDENGNIVDFNFGETKTPHLEHLLNNEEIDAIVCQTLAQ
jgi:hypothetical protein